MMAPAIHASIMASNIATMNAAANSARNREHGDEFMFESRRRANELWLWAFGGFIGALMCFLVFLVIGLFYN